MARLDQGDKGGPRGLIIPRRRALAGVPPTPVVPNTIAKLNLRCDAPRVFELNLTFFIPLVIF